MQPVEIEAANFAFTAGMELRDYFAAKAPPPPHFWVDTNLPIKQQATNIALWNYCYADAMLAARIRK